MKTAVDAVIRKDGAYNADLLAAVAKPGRQI